MDQAKRGLSPVQKKLRMLFLGKAPSAYFPQLNIIFGHQLGLLLSQLAYWEGKQSDSNNGWIYKTEQELKSETGLTAANQKYAIKLGVKIGILEMSYRRIPRRRHYKVLWTKVAEIIEFEAPNHGLNVSLKTMQLGGSHLANTETTQSLLTKSAVSVDKIAEERLKYFKWRKSKKDQNA